MKRTVAVFALVIGTLSNRIRPWKREARDGHGYQHLRQLYYRGGYIKENDHGDGTAIFDSGQNEVSQDSK